MPKYKLLSASIAFSLLMSHQAYAHDEAFDQLSTKIADQSQSWYQHLDAQVVTPFPKKGTLEAEVDRKISWDMQNNTTAERLALAEEDKNQSFAHVSHEFRKSALKEFAPHITDEQFVNIFKNLVYLSANAIYSDDSNVGRMRAYDFILKDKYLRGRPYQVMDREGKYIEGYENLKTYIDSQGRERKNSSYPSGHTSNGFGQAVVMAMAFPERGQEVFSRALQYGESRVIVGAHFPTDTMTSRLARYYYMAQLLNDDEIAQGLVRHIKQARQPFEESCQNAPLKSCLEMLPQDLHEQYKASDYHIGYYGTLKSDEKASRLEPEEMPGTAGALLRLRFNYLDGDARRQVLASTAYPKNSHAHMGDLDNKNHTWGLINLPKAYDGISHIYQDIETTTQDKHLDFAGFSLEDTWKNDISGTGRLILNHPGELTLSGNNTFAGATVKQGHLKFTGNNALADDSYINQGTMSVTGQFQSKVVLNHDAKMMIVGQSDQPTTVQEIELSAKDSWVYVAPKGVFQVNANSQENNTTTDSQISIQTLSGVGHVMVKDHSNLHIDKLSGETIFAINPSDAPVKINELKGRHGVGIPSHISKDKNHQSLLKVDNNQGSFYLIDTNNNVVDAAEQGAYAYQLVMRPNNTLQLSQFANDNSPIASSMTKTALNTGMGSLYTLSSQMNHLGSMNNRQSVWLNHRYQENNIKSHNTQFDLKLNQTTLGAGSKVGQTYLGAYINKSEGDVDHVFGGKNDLDATGFGVYLNRLLPNQQEIFLQGAWQNVRQKIHAKQANHDNLTASIKDNTWAIALGAQQQMKFHNVDFQPSFEIGHIQTNPKSFRYDQMPNLQINPKKASMTTVNIGTKISKNYGLLQPYLKAKMFYQDTKQDLNIIDMNNEVSWWSTDLSGFGFAGALGVTSQINSRFFISGEASAQYQEEVKTPIEAKLSLNYQF